MSGLAAALRGSRPLIADGASGTWLQSIGLTAGEAPEAWTLKNPEAIRLLATGYVTAGSDIIYTNTFGGNRVRLKCSGLENDISEINRRAVRLAREATDGAPRDIFVVASIGPTGEILEPYGDLEPDDARAVFLEVAALLFNEGVDGFACETFSSLEEASLCLDAVREVAPDLPVFASMAFESVGKTMMGVSPEEAVQALRDAGADVVGANCSIGPEVVEKALLAMHAASPATPLLAKPNAGLPVVASGKATYPVTPQDLADFALRAKEIGASVIGGCCGTTPAHICAIREALNP